MFFFKNARESSRSKVVGEDDYEGEPEIFDEKRESISSGRDQLPKRTSQDKKGQLADRWVSLWCAVESYDRLRTSAYLSKYDQKHQSNLSKKRDNHSARSHGRSAAQLKAFIKEGYGDLAGHRDKISNVAELKLTVLENDLLSRGLKFSVTQPKSREVV